MATIYDFRDPPNMEHDIDESKLVCYAHTPKCAGKSICETLKLYQIPKAHGSMFLHVHTSLATLRKYLPFTIITSVRNPWKREVSAYEYSREQYEIMGDESNDLLKFAYECDFKEFITLKYEAFKGGIFWAHCMPIFSYKNYEPMAMWLPQKFFAYSDGDPNKGRADHIIRVEHIQKDIDKLLENFELSSAKAEHVNASKNTKQHIDYHDYYDSNTKDFVYYMEKEIIEEFKYEY